MSSARVRVKEWLLELNATAKLPQGDGKVIIGYIHSHGDSGGKKVRTAVRLLTCNTSQQRCNSV